MLDVMRSNARSSLIVLVFGALIFVFIFSFGRGSSGFKSVGAESWAAKVNGEIVTYGDFSQAYSNRFRQMSAMRGGKYTVDNAKQDDLKKITLDNLVDQELIAQQADDLGIVVGDGEVADAIAKSPQFQQEGKFDFDYYKRLVENGYGMSVPRFEEAYRRDLLRGKVIQAAIAGAAASDDEVKAAWIAQHEGAAITYVRFNPFMFRDKATATDAEIAEFVKAHPDEIQKRYDAEVGGRWTLPAAARVRVITVSVRPNARPEDEKAARARIDAALAEVKGGKDFAEVAKEKSDDASKAQGGDIGFVARGQSPYGKTLEDQAANLKVGQISDVFKDRSGFHILKAEELRAGRVQPLDEVRKEVAADLIKAQKAKDLAKKQAEETLAQLRAGKDLKSLYPEKKPPEEGQFDLAALMKPQSAETDTFHPGGGYIPGIGQAPALSAAVFSLTRAGDVPPAPVEDNDTWYVFKLKSRERADPSKLDAKEMSSIRDRLVTQKQNELYAKWVDGLRKRSKIAENPAVLSYDVTPGHEQFTPDDF